MFHVEHDYLMTWRRYSRALKQRNAALRTQNLPVIESLDEILSGLGEKLDIARQDQMDRLSTNLVSTLTELSPELEGINIRYDKGWKGKNLLSALQENRNRDLDRCLTGPGPHKADIIIHLDKKLARERLSRGEQKILSASLLISQGKLMSESGERPVVLMDDLASEFDETHLTGILAAVNRLETQVLVTGTSLTPYQSLAKEKYAMFHVEHGIITSETMA